MPASGDGTANEYPRNHLQGNARPTVVCPPAPEPEPDSAQEFGRYPPSRGWLTTPVLRLLLMFNKKLMIGAGDVLLDSSLIPSPPIMPQDRARVDDP